MRKVQRASKREPIISLINIVFLILIFFMVAGSLSGPKHDSLEFTQTSDLDCCVPPDALIILQDNSLSHEGQDNVSLHQYLQSQPPETSVIKILPDKNLPARDLLSRIKEIKTQGAFQIVIMTENISQ